MLCVVICRRIGGSGCYYVGGFEGLGINMSKDLRVLVLICRRI